MPKLLKLFFQTFKFSWASRAQGERRMAIERGYNANGITGIEGAMKRIDRRWMNHKFARKPRYETVVFVESGVNAVITLPPANYQTSPRLLYRDNNRLSISSMCVYIHVCVYHSLFTRYSIPCRRCAPTMRFRLLRGTLYMLVYTENFYSVKRLKPIVHTLFVVSKILFANQWYNYC